MKDRYNAALKDVGDTFGRNVLFSICVGFEFGCCCCCFMFHQYLHAPSEEYYS